MRMWFGRVGGASACDVNVQTMVVKGDYCRQLRFGVGRIAKTWSGLCTRGEWKLKSQRGSVNALFLFYFF